IKQKHQFSLGKHAHRSFCTKRGGRDVLGLSPKEFDSLRVRNRLFVQGRSPMIFCGCLADFSCAKLVGRSPLAVHWRAYGFGFAPVFPRHTFASTFLCSLPFFDEISRFACTWETLMTSRIKKIVGRSQRATLVLIISIATVLII